LKCYKHNAIDIVIKCHNCKKGLCSDCSNRFDAILCEDCLLAHNEMVKSSNKKSLITAIVLFVLCLLLSGDLFIGFLFAYIFAGIPLGWKAIDKITPDFLLIMPIIGWIIFFLYKLIFSAIIGVFMTPFHIRRLVKEMTMATKINQDIIDGKI
jgi:hypothetical protein